MLLDVLALVARKDYTEHRRRQAQGIAKVKDAGPYRGRQADTKRHAVIKHMLARGMAWFQVCEATGASRSTLSRIMKAEPVDAS